MITMIVKAIHLRSRTSYKEHEMPREDEHKSQEEGEKLNENASDKSEINGEKEKIEKRKR